LNRPLPSEIGIGTVALKVGIPQLLFSQFHACCKEIIWSLDWKLMACRLVTAGKWGGPARLLPLASPQYFYIYIYSTAIETEEDLVARLPRERETIQKMTGIFEKMRQNMVRRHCACSGVGGW